MPTPEAPPAALNVLVVDDDVDAAESLAFCLQADGRTVRYATSGAQALALAEALAPDVALIDLFMPGVDGYALATEMRRRFAPTILVAVTGALKRVDSGPFDFHLTKPVDFDQLQQMLRLSPARVAGR